jgi:hypothetical protein
MDTSNDVFTFCTVLGSLVSDKTITENTALKMSMYTHQFGLHRFFRKLEHECLSFGLDIKTEVLVAARFSEKFWMD